LISKKSGLFVGEWKEMRILRLTFLLLGLLHFGCNQTHSENDSNTVDDKEQIQGLIRRMLNWSSEHPIELLPVLTDSKDSSCIGFDFYKHKLNLDQLKKTNLFSEEFIENYNQIIQTLDRKIKSKEFDKWYPYGELPTFAFANDVDPWCLCQDIPYDKPNPWDLVEVTPINLNKIKGELFWKWGKLELKEDVGWKEFSYKFRVLKEKGQWKIEYLEGFDFNNSTRKGG
jgi:hypothetical protein